MGNFFSKFFMSFGLNKNKYLPVGTEDLTDSVSNDLTNSANNTVVAAMRNAAKASNTSKTIKTLASFDLNIEKPKFEGAVPEATIKFYPLD